MHWHVNLVSHDHRIEERISTFWSLEKAEGQKTRMNAVMQGSHRFYKLTVTGCKSVECILEAFAQ
jgi:hypothetical protein